MVRHGIILSIARYKHSFLILLSAALLLSASFAQPALPEGPARHTGQHEWASTGPVSADFFRFAHRSVDDGTTAWKTETIDPPGTAPCSGNVLETAFDAPPLSSYLVYTETTTSCL